MQSVGIILRNAKTDYLGSCCCFTIVSLAILVIMIASLLPALASEPFATDPAAQPATGHATAVASAQIIKPYMIDSTAQPGTMVPDSTIMVSQRTTYRRCETLLGADATRVTGASCELRLIELQ